jgi:hypothetical protein
MTTPNTGVRYDTGPTIAVAVKDQTASWNDGHFFGDPEVVKFAEHMAAGQIPIEVFNQTITASYDDPLGALAAMAGYWPGRVIVTEAPDEIVEAIQIEPYMGYANTEDGHDIVTAGDEITDDQLEAIVAGGDS